MEIIKYDKFTVYRNKDKNVFLHIDINTKEFYKNLLDYFFDESKILQYISNKTNIYFQNTKIDCVKLYRKITDFIDDENLESDNKLLLDIRTDKLGKVGEYIFHHVLIDFFKASCIIPKLNLTSNKNMNVYGIDVIFYNSNDNTLMFGESKVSKSLDNGIKLVNESLKKYEKQISEEYRLILSNEIFHKSNIPKSLYKYMDNCINFETFIKEAGIDMISIPIFIMHGKEIQVKNILNKMNKLKKTMVLNLRINYIIISLPIVDKTEFEKYLVEFLKEKSDYYYEQSHVQL